MPKEKATRKTKAKAVSDGGKKKKGTQLLPPTTLGIANALTARIRRPQCAQARSLCLHVLCQ